MIRLVTYVKSRSNPSCDIKAAMGPDRANKLMSSEQNASNKIAFAIAQGSRSEDIYSLFKKLCLRSEGESHSLVSMHFSLQHAHESTTSGRS